MFGGRAPLSRPGASCAEVMPCPSFILQEVRRGSRLGDGTRPSFLGLAPALKKCWLKKHTTVWTERTQAPAALSTSFSEGCGVRRLLQRLQGLCPLAATDRSHLLALCPGIYSPGMGEKRLCSLSASVTWSNDHCVSMCGPFVPTWWHPQMPCSSLAWSSDKELRPGSPH